MSNPELIEVEADLCHRGNYENIVGQPDMVHTPTPGVIPDLMWFTCASEANGINMFPCTGSRHIDHRTVVICTCACHRSAQARRWIETCVDPVAVGPMRKLPQHPVSSSSADLDVEDDRR